MTSLTLNIVIFDLFGTLVQFGVQHHPYRQLMKWARDNGRKPKADDARMIMTVNGNIEATSIALGMSPPDDLIDRLQDQIDEELNSLRLFDDVLPTMRTLADQKIKIGICSNLAQPYGRAIDELLSDFEFKRFLSYEMGCIKPELGTYQRILKDFDCTPQSCLFVGDTYEADYLGPLSVGMTALHLQRNGVVKPNQITSLRELLDNRILKQINPPHPGEFIRRIFMEPVNLSADALSVKLGIPVANLNQLLDGKISIDLDWADRLSKSIGRSPESWLVMQKNFDESKLPLE